MRLLIISIISFSIFFLWTKGNQSYENSREVILADIIIDPSKPANNIITDRNYSLAEKFCYHWFGNIEETNCRDGKKLKTENFKKTFSEQLKEIFKEFGYKNHKFHKQLDKNISWEHSINFCENRLNELIFLRSELLLIENPNISIKTLVFSLDEKISLVEEKLTYLKTSFVKKNELEINDFKVLFDLLLTLEGYTYSTNSGEFKKTSWDIARVLDQPKNFNEKISLNANINKALPFLLILPAAFLAYAMSSYVKLYGNICILVTTWLMSLGFLFTVDASVNYGRTSPIFLVNPFLNQINREALILLISYIAILCGFYSKNLFENLLFKVENKIIYSCLIGITIVTLSYAFVSPALGSEFLKIVVVIFASITTYRHAREYYLAKKYSLNNFTILKIAKKLLKKTKNNQSEVLASEFIFEHIFKSFLSLIFVSAITLTLASLVFGDLGGALVITLILIVLIFLIFGTKLALIGISVFLLISLPLTFTNKVQERINLMLEPMYATVSDFARVIGFIKASGENGFGIGKVAWCSNEGICLPLQVLSDYVPTLLVGSIGFKNSIFIFIIYVILFLFIAIKSIYFFLLPSQKYKLIGIFIFYLSTAYLIQTLITFFGNWRIIPLTGLSIPFMSIGLSSNIFPCFMVGIFISMNINRNNKD